MSYDPDPDPNPRDQWPPPYKRRPMGIIATVVAVIAGVMGLAVVAFFILMAIALNSWGNTK
ncbi:MAG: hypothetical protein QOD63_588 [Actinomycetota bacterium]|jgi:hypothetical protein|nr:hypothetical protein [Actinomycetota bacterium]